MATVSIGSRVSPVRDYGTFKLFADAVLAGTVTGASTSDPILGEFYPDSPFNDDIVTILTSDPGDSYSECVMQPAATFEHDMTEGSGVVFKLTANAAAGYYNCDRTPYHIKGVEFDAAGFRATTGTGATALVRGAGLGGRKPKFSRLMIHGVKTSNRAVGLDLSGSYSCAIMVYDIESTHTGSQPCRGVSFINSATQSAHMASLTVDDIRNTGGAGLAYAIDVANNAARTVDCCVASTPTGTSSGAKAAFNGGSSIGGTNNAAGDTSISWGSSNQPSLTPANIWQATSVGVGYLKTKASGALEDTGKTVSDPTTTPSIDMSLDALGNDRASVTTEDIGVHELELDGAVGATTSPWNYYAQQ